MDFAEEKMDEFLQQMVDEPEKLAKPEDQSSYYVLLRELAAFLSEKHYELEREQPLKKKKIEIAADAEQMLRDAATSLSDARPPADFVVFADGTLGLDGHRPSSTRPPIFDGGVANATPPPLGGPGTGAFGGSGTILHLACALDVPLALAFLLAMHADARASHTAFRRLMIHEAACNGSIGCLTLLLELAEKFGDKDAANGVSSNPSRMEIDLPFLPRRIDRIEAMAPLQMYARHSFFAVGRKPAPEPVEPGKDFLSVLRLFRECVAQVEDGSISELDAARKVLEVAQISPASQQSLARSGGFLNEAAVSRNFMRPLTGNSDGHGNTPLHWAAFKNETECVSLLLRYKADPNARAHPSGWTPLHDAAYSNSSETIELLLNAGAYVDSRANSGATPLCFAAQEDAAEAAGLLLDRGADLTTRCAGGPVRDDGSVAGGPHSRFSGYTPLHYCAHYNAAKAAKVLLMHGRSKQATEVPDLSERLPIHVAVARGSSDVLRELLHAGARVETRSMVDSSSNNRRRLSSMRSSSSTISNDSAPATPPRSLPPSPERRVTPRSRGGVVTPVSSPLLRSMIPAQPVTSSKPWNCLTQRSIDECRQLISEAEQSWTPDRHSLFTPADRAAVMELLRVGKRLELQGTGLFIDLWPQVLSFCGRGWFEIADATSEMDEDSSDESMPDDRLALPTF